MTKPESCRDTAGHRAHGDCPGVAFTPKRISRARRSHPLAERVTYVGRGFTEYDGNVQIWDAS